MPQNNWEINLFLENVCDALNRLLKFENGIKKDYQNATERQKTLYVVYHGKIMAYLYVLQELKRLSDKPKKWEKQYQKYYKLTNKLWDIKNSKPQCNYL